MARIMQMPSPAENVNKSKDDNIVCDLLNKLSPNRSHGYSGNDAFGRSSGLQ